MPIGVIPLSALKLAKILDIDDLKVISGYTFLADAVLLAAFGLLGGLLIPELTGTFHRGFFCDDQSIQYVYRSDTVTPTELFLYAFLVIAVTIIATEYYRAKKIRRIPIPQYRLGNTSVHYIIVRVMTYIGYSMIGLVCVFVLTNVTKSCVGRLRPHFLDVCKPLNITCQRSE
ncbi:hypothetical protein OESDEN_03243 [Oesophagostomum dentatum]|uniref:Phosphatidic acid phosphatase type 2/haloperoxidase domain-containing protein n=1 Tax=Oesophagostomum dentatum TaxID=61180 RepID=A0A0B1TLT7_OESDE|nr:hypothetical protein OESDEN_03243 [Oesophagostomum dentatum]